MPKKEYSSYCYMKMKINFVLFDNTFFDFRLIVGYQYCIIYTKANILRMDIIHISLRAKKKEGEI